MIKILNFSDFCDEWNMYQDHYTAADRLDNLFPYKETKKQKIVSVAVILLFIIICGLIK